ncbi:MAG: histidinol-phosphatase HisJ family protein [Candidatus Cloacimonetes bacterium]|nr:histidinol-phosphatase HisJ family protein [Candidatus Cloacimonadota bacterium]MDD2506621.1 histidinol-phosphatase HisJ family protein [Candidatus Cloacimonadota bacterium]MDD4560240.1 histidinol-phosphatase HisJ family protein [Candidatus Cloacimonadota bacterium]
MNYDYHIHSEFSYDSRMLSADLVKKAIDLRFDEIALTEHLDLLPQELSVYGLPSLQKYRNHCMKLQAEYSAIKLRMGIEIGDYHQVQSFAEKLISSFNFSPILGSVHFLSDHTNVAIPLSAPLSPSQIEDYYLQNLVLVQSCNFNILAHFGVYKRYYDTPPDEHHVQPIIDEILRTIIKRDISLEINLSSLRKPYGQIIPEIDLIRHYHELGGKFISIGSDSHSLDHFNRIPDFVLDICKDFSPPPLS